MTSPLLGALIGLVVGGALVCITYVWYIRPNQARLKSARADILEEQEQHEKEIEARRKEVLLEAKEEAYKIRAEIEKDNKSQRAEIQRLERRLTQKEESLDRRLDNLDRKEKTVATREADSQKKLEEVDQIVQQQRQELERVARLSTDEAKDLLLRQIDREMERETARVIRQAEEQAREEADRKARDIITLAIQRCAVDQATETTVSVVPLPGDDMKGRIIGREGRNIRALEAATGVEIIVDDTPEAIILSAFDPVRREIARLSLHQLVTDGRIHPARIEEVVNKVKKQVEDEVIETGKRTTIDLGIHGLHPELIRLLGKMKYRSSYGQNLLQHSREVANLCSIMAAELGLNAKTAKRAGLLHDIGKVADDEPELPHAILGMKLAERFKEKADVCNAIGSHHEEVEMTTLIAPIVQVCDAISGARPGARREAVESYIKRLKELENLALNYPGVVKTFAIQAGRELRVVVGSDKVSDKEAETLSYDIAKKIQDEMTYPGQVKITVIRETRAVSFAK